MAFQQADYVAWNLWASINRRPLLPFKYQHLGEMMSLGRARGAVTLPVPLAPPLRQALDGGGVIGSLLSIAGIKCALAASTQHRLSLRLASRGGQDPLRLTHAQEATGSTPLLTSACSSYARRSGMLFVMACVHENGTVCTGWGAMRMGRG